MKRILLILAFVVGSTGLVINAQPTPPRPPLPPRPAHPTVKKKKPVKKAAHYKPPTKRTKANFNPRAEIEREHSKRVAEAKAAAARRPKPPTPPMPPAPPRP